MELGKEILSFGDPNLNKLDSYTVEITSRMVAARFRREIWFLFLLCRSSGNFSAGRSCTEDTVDSKNI